MEKLFYENPYEKEFTAEIINVLEKDNKYLIELDKTYFYPKGGSLPSDTGSINGANVVSVYEDNGIVYHVVELKPSKIHKVKCIIHWEKRFDYLQQHIGQHIISGCFEELFSINTISTDFGKDYSDVDINKTITQDEIKKVEEMANKIVLNNMNIETLYLTNAELKKLSLKKIHTKANEKIRLIKIGDFYSPCDEIHLTSTIQVQLIKIINWEKRGTGTRIEFLCGSRATSDYFSKYEVLEKASNLLHCKDATILSVVEGLATELNKAVFERNLLKTQVAEYEVQDMLNSCENIKNIRILKSIYENVDLQYVNLLSSKLTSFSDVIVLFGVKSEDKTNLIFMCSKNLKIISMNLLLKDAITLIDGKGGGSDFSAQGGGKSSNNLPSCLDYALSKVKDSILGL